MNENLEVFSSAEFKDITQDLRDLLSQSRLAILLGAGCSYKAGLPLMPELTDEVFSHESLSHKTKDILHVKRLLGHRKLENTEIYTHLINFESDEWHVAHAKDLDEENKLIEAGFEYVRYSNRDELAIYRKRK